MKYFPLYAFSWVRMASQSKKCSMDSAFFEIHTAFLMKRHAATPSRLIAESSPILCVSSLSQMSFRFFMRRGVDEWPVGKEGIVTPNMAKK